MKVVKEDWGDDLNFSNITQLWFGPLTDPKTLRRTNLMSVCHRLCSDEPNIKTAVVYSLESNQMTLSYEYKEEQYSYY